MEKLKKEIQLVVDIYKSKDLLKAETLTRELISNNPNIAFLYNLLGLILVDQKKIEEAIKYYNEGIKKDKNFSMLYNNLGILYFRHKNDKQKAEDYYKKSIAIDNKIPEPFNNLGTLYNSLDKTEDAIVCCDNILSGNAFFISDVEISTALTLNNKGYALSLLGKFEDALEYHDKALTIDDKNEKIHVNKAFALIGLSRFEESLKNSEHAISINQNYAMAWNNAGYALHKLDRNDDALEYVEKALDLDPTDLDALDSKRTILKSLGRIS